MNPKVPLVALAAIVACSFPYPSHSQELVRKVRVFKPIPSGKAKPVSVASKVAINQFGFRGEEEPAPAVPAPAPPALEPPVPSNDENENLGIPPLPPEDIGKLGTETIPPPPLEEAVRMSTRFSENDKKTEEKPQSESNSKAKESKSSKVASNSQSSNSSSSSRGKSSYSSRSRWGRSSGNCSGGS